MKSRVVELQIAGVCENMKNNYNENCMQQKRSGN